MSSVRPTFYLPSLVAVLAASLVSASCARTERSESSKASSTPKLEEDRNSGGVTMGRPLFSCGYANSAWGRVAYGHVLDDQGRIWSYDLENSRSASSATGGADRASSLRERFPNPVLQSRRIPLELLAPQRKKAELARDGRIETRQVAFDAGGAACHAYLWEGTDAHREVELGGSGNSVVVNASPEAGELRTWLRDELGLGARSESLRNTR